MDIHFLIHIFHRENKANPEIVSQIFFPCPYSHYSLGIVTQNNDSNRWQKPTASYHDCVLNEC